MDEVICRSLKGRLSEAEEGELLSWRRASTGNAAYYRELVRLLETAESAALGQSLPEAPRVAELIEGRRPDAVLASEHARRSSGRRLGRVGAAIAAAAVLAALVLGPVRRNLAPPAEFSFGTGEIVTGASETVTVTLGDGTVVRLAPESRLRVTGASSAREVWLDGRAYFAVAKHEDRPFRVRTHAGDAQVLGTRFDLQARQGDLRLMVVEGAVRLNSRGSTVELEAREMAEVSGTRPLVTEKVESSSMRRELNWMGNFLVFEGTPLAHAAQELSLHYGVPIHVLDTRLGQETVHGWFSDEELEDVLRVICRAVAAHCSIRPSGVTIEP